MKRFLSLSISVLLVLSLSQTSSSQGENVPVSNSVYNFLKRMELKGIIERYHDAILPLSRREVSGYLKTIDTKKDDITSIDRDLLEDYLIEFEYDISKTTTNAASLLGNDEFSLGSSFRSLLSEKEKYLYSYTDTNVSFFVDGLLTWDGRRSTGDAMGGANATFLQFGGRIRGTIYDKLGYYIQGTNAQFWGSRDVLRRDKQISQAYTLGILNARNFDFVEGYVRYDANIVSLQVGRERVLWGNGYGDKMILSDNVRVFDFIRADAQYKWLKYTFMHAWLLGKRSELMFTLTSDPSATFVEPIVSDKYFAAHRLEFSFPSLFDLGFQEMAIYSNRAPDLAYLNPATLIESAQRSREERDNIFWAFDIQTHFLKNVEFQATMLFDDINFAKWGTNSWENRYAYQLGLMAVDPWNVSNTSLAVEYTRVEPYTFSHGRSRDNDYGSLSRILSHHIGPNADSWFFRLDHSFSHKLLSSLRFEVVHKGENVYDASGKLIKNVGGDFLQPHRDTDSLEKDFRGGNYVRTLLGQAFVTYEIVNEVFFDLRYQFQQKWNSGLGIITTDHDYCLAIRFDF
jgi:hypothetical protein